MLPLFCALLVLSSCKKDALEAPKAPSDAVDLSNPALLKSSKSAARQTLPNGYQKYVIPTGAHNCLENTFMNRSLSQMNFKAIFDNTAIYTTVNPANQNDINMLYGFSDGFNHLFNSARIGWSQDGNPLDPVRLYAYAYKRGIREIQYITSVMPGIETTCSIKLTGNTYTFTINNGVSTVTVTLQRGLSTYSTIGYQLYPYFGGTETAPHEIDIQIKNT